MDRPMNPVPTLDALNVRVGATVRDGVACVTLSFRIKQQPPDFPPMTIAIPLDVFDDIGVDGAFFYERARAKTDPDAG